MLFSISAFSQTKDDYIKRFEAVGEFLRQHTNIDIHRLPIQDAARIMRERGGLRIDLVQADRVRDSVRRLDNYIASLGGSAASPASIKSLFPFLSVNDSVKIANAIDNNSTSPSPQSALAGLAARSLGVSLIEFGKILDNFLREASRPARPDSPNSLSLKRIMNRANKVQRIRLPKASGDYFSNMYTSFDYTYTEFEDTNTNTRGQIHDFSLNLHGTILDNTDFSVGLLGSEFESHSVGEDRNKTVGVDFLLLHKLTENYGVGLYGYFQETDYEEINGNAWGAGGGILFSTWHDLGPVELSTVHTLTTAHYEYGHDNIWVSNAALTRYWTDWFSTTISAGFTDSIRHDDVGDNSYWTLGGSLGFQIGDKLHLSLGFESDVKIKDYKNEVYRISLAYYF